VVRDEEVKAYELTGIFTNESIEEALQLLQVIAPFKYKISNGEIIINK
jgi:transmembrane sensor